MNKSYAVLGASIALAAMDLGVIQRLRHKNKALVKLTKALLAQNENLVEGLYSFDASVDYLTSRLEDINLPVDEFDRIIQSLADSAQV